MKFYLHLLSHPPPPPIRLLLRWALMDGMFSGRFVEELSFDAFHIMTSASCVIRLVLSLSLTPPVRKYLIHLCFTLIIYY